jgi:hypothetical protein
VNQPDQEQTMDANTQQMIATRLFAACESAGDAAPAVLRAERRERLARSSRPAAALRGLRFDEWMTL